MNPPYFVPDLLKEIDPPERGILSRTLHTDDDVKVVLFAFSAGHELSAHTAPGPVSIHILAGEADLTLGDDQRVVAAGAFALLPPNLTHAIVARTPLVMLLTMIKGFKRPTGGVKVE